MKLPLRKFLRQIILGCGIILALASCSKTKIVTMNAMRPADIHLNPEIKNILVLDRTKQKDAVNIIEGVLTGELPQEDKAAVQQIMSSLRGTLLNSPRFQSNIASERLQGNSLTAAFPAPLSWSQIDDLCNRYNVQAVVAIEIFDSDFIITDGKKRTKKTVGEGANKKEVEVDEYFAEGVANLKAGIRLYDQKGQRIIDEQLISRTNKWRATAASKADAIAKLINKRDATLQMGKQIGSDYAYKIAPLPIRVSRTFYKKHRKAPAIESGTRQADVNQWNDALDTWKNGIPMAGEKQAGYLTYNVAIAYEVIGEFDLAIQWAQDAYTRYGNKKARDYVRVLYARKANEERANRQME